MEVSRYLVFLILAVTFLTNLAAPTKKKKDKKGGKNRKYSGRCKPTILAEYELVFEGLWSTKNYPRMFPRNRQMAQWSVLVGRSHTDTYTMWAEDKLADRATQQFAQAADTQGFELQSQAFGGIKDAFSAPPIEGGLGRTITNFLADGLHSKLSFMVKIVPSPDWFVGVSSLDLCEKKKWKRTIDLNLYPMDAGTDRGLTFTSPNWPSIPRENIYRLSPSKPSHSASAFYDENMTSLPPIAKLSLRKVGEYKRRGKGTVAKQQQQNIVIFNDLPEADKPASAVTQTHNRLTGGNGQVTLSNDIDLYAPRAEAQRGDVPGCKVSSWSAWSPCSRTCGFGHQERRRTIIRRSIIPGLYCPVLREDRTCGSMKSCEWDSFQILGRNG